MDLNHHPVGMDLCGQTAVKSISWETLFLNQLYNYPLLSSN